MALQPIQVPAEVAGQVEKRQQSLLSEADHPALDYARTVGVLLDSGVSLEARGEMGDTPLIRAASFGQTATVRLLLQTGANVEAKDDGGNTPLTAAACSCAIVDMRDTFDSIKLLLQKKTRTETPPCSSRPQEARSRLPTQ